jgi:hypothetical protein
MVYLVGSSVSTLAAGMEAGTKLGNKLLEAIGVYLLLRASSTHCEPVFPCSVST